jgi:putative thiamine transport system ATP-binding protein
MSSVSTVTSGLTLAGVSVALRARTLISISATIAPGDVLTVMGPSGSGKSTLLAFIGGFLDPVFKATGRIFIDGIDVTAMPANQRHAGILFQDPLLFPHMSVGENLLFAIPEHVKGKAARNAQALAALEDMELAGCFHHDPATLSGGQKARVALARTLVSQPKALLLDEPFSRLDAALRSQMRELVFSHAKAQMLPVVLVTHDAEDASAAGGQLIEIA